VISPPSIKSCPELNLRKPDEEAEVIGGLNLTIEHAVVEFNKVFTLPRPLSESLLKWPSLLALERRPSDSEGSFAAELSHLKTENPS
jgi:hypothetical protein